MNRAIIAAALIATLPLALAGCAGTSSDPSGTVAAASGQASSVSYTDGWVKAVPADGMKMSAMFGTLHNAATQEATLVSAECGPTVGMVELHETVADGSGGMKMQPKDGGMVIPAGGSLELAPGGNHIMLMGLTDALKAGDELSCVATFADGTTMRLTAPVKDFAGANESYHGGATPAPTPTAAG